MSSAALSCVRPMAFLLSLIRRPISTNCLCVTVIIPFLSGKIIILSKRERLEHLYVPIFIYNIH